MTKYFFVPVFALLTSMFLSCTPEDLIDIALPDNKCGPDVDMGTRTISNKAFSMAEPVHIGKNFVFTDAAGTEHTLILDEIRKENTQLKYKSLCYNYQYNYGQYETVTAPILTYIYRTAPGASDEIRYSWFTDFVPVEGTLYDKFDASVYFGKNLGGHADFVADNYGQALPAEITAPGEYEKELGNITLQGRSFQDVIFCGWGVNAGKGFYFQKGKGIVALQFAPDNLWVLDRVQ